MSMKPPSGEDSRDMGAICVARICWIGAIATALAACNPQHRQVPSSLSGRAYVTYVSTSESVALFRLENETAQTIKINGSGNSLTGFDLTFGDYRMSCTKGDKGDVDRSGFKDPPKFAELKPGDRVSMRVHTELTQRYRSGRCELWLTEDGAEVKSIEFVP